MNTSQTMKKILAVQSGQSSSYFNPIKNIFIILALACSVSFKGDNVMDTPKETKLFDVVFKGDKIGTLKVKRHERKDKTIYTSNTRIKTTILLIKKINIRHKYRVSYQSEQLLLSKVTIKVNKKKPERIKVRQSDNGYLIKSNSEDTYRIDEPIKYSSILLYFEEPKNITKSFSERSGNFNAIDQMDDGSYRIINEEGDENRYYYTDGQLSLMKVDGGMVNFEIRARQP